GRELAATSPRRKSGTTPEKGKVLAVEISRYRTALSGPQGELVQVMGDPDDPEVQVQSIVFRYGLAASFPEPVHREIASCSFAAREEEIAARTDLRELPIVTIDGERDRGFTEAECVRKNNGH